MIKNPDRNKRCEILKNAGSIAVVGFSSDPNKTSREIADFLVDNGFNVVGVNPNFEGETDMPVYSSLMDVPFEIDIANVFMRSENIDLINKDVLNKKPKVLWLQLGIRNDEAVVPAEKTGITIVQDECIKINHYHCF